MKNLHGMDPLHYQVEGLCRLFGVTKQAYYKYDESHVLQKVAQEAFAVSYIKDKRQQDPGIGGMSCPEIALQRKKELNKKRVKLW